MTETLVYSQFCDIGRRLDGQRANDRAYLSRVALQFQDDEDSPRLAVQLAQARDTFRQTSIELARHAGSCDGCVRVAGQNAEMTAWRRAPTLAKPDLPAMSEIAARLRDGEALEVIAQQYDRTVATIRLRLSGAGFHSTTGKSLTKPTKAATQPATPRPRDQTWRLSALCAQTDPESFFPEKGGSTRHAKAMCQSCTVAAECLDEALANNERHGIWGGLSERDRRRLQHQLGLVDDDDADDDHLEDDLEDDTTRKEAS